MLDDCLRIISIEEKGHTVCDFYEKHGVNENIFSKLQYGCIRNDVNMISFRGC